MCCEQTDKIVSYSVRIIFVYTVAVVIIGLGEVPIHRGACGLFWFC